MSITTVHDNSWPLGIDGKHFEIPKVGNLYISGGRGTGKSESPQHLLVNRPGIS